MSSLRNSYRQVACPEAGPVLRAMTDTGIVAGQKGAGRRLDRT